MKSKVVVFLMGVITGMVIAIMTVLVIGNWEKLF